MDLRIFTEPQQGGTYDDQLAIAQAAEELGFSGFFRSDHFLAQGRDGQPGPTDAWVTLAGLARETSRIRLGTLVSSATFRHPGLLAIQVAQVDQMSGGRVELGLGGGWFEAEHRAYGVPFPADRSSRLEEQLEIVTGLWAADGRYDFAGRHYTLEDSPALPKPSQTSALRGGPGVPVIIGGAGPRRTPRLVARFADEYNQAFPALDAVRPRIAVVRAACEEAGRDPATLVQSVALTTVAAADEAEFLRRAQAIGADPRSLRQRGLAGTPAQVVDRLGALAADGVTRVYLQLVDQQDLDHLALIAAEVAPQVAAPVGGQG